MSFSAMGDELHGCGPRGCRRKVLSELGLLDAQVIAAYEAQKTAGGPAEQAASGPYNAELTG